MLKLVGVVAEYNPFTRGHGHHLAEARARSGADGVVVVMSSTFVQRGAPAILTPHARAEMALRCGADVVVALPALWSVREAEWFAMGAVSLLHQLGCDGISFGTEQNQLPLMAAVADLLEQPTGAFQEIVQQGLNRGWRHPQAVAHGAEQLLPGAERLLSTPNSTLGICYLRALRRMCIPMAVYPVERLSDYHGESMAVPLPSATALRRAIYGGDWKAVQQAMPGNAYDILLRERNAGRLMPQGGLNQAMMYRLRTMTRDEYHRLPGATEGMENWLRKQSAKAGTFDALMQRLATRRYPAARLRRMCIHGLLGITGADMATHPLPTAAHLLGYRDAAVLRQVGQSELPLVTNPKKITPAPPWVQAEERGYDIWSLGIGAPPGMMATTSLWTPRSAQSSK